MGCGQARRLPWADNLDFTLTIYLNTDLKARFPHYALIIYLSLNRGVSYLLFRTNFTKPVKYNLLSTVTYAKEEKKNLLWGSVSQSVVPRSPV